MSLRTQLLPPVPAATAAAMQAAFPQGNLYVELRAEFGTLYDDQLFADLYPPQGGPVEVAPWRLALVVVMPYIEGLTDRQAADGVESSLSQEVRRFDLRRSRYLGLAWTHLQQVLTATAMNMVRVMAWLQGEPLRERQWKPGHLAQLAPHPLSRQTVLCERMIYPTESLLTRVGPTSSSLLNVGFSLRSAPAESESRPTRQAVHPNDGLPLH